jgi:putative nucleotidyltransferase with HDIG domain
MLQFETSNVWRHSVYGYLFLKYLSPLQEYADLVLYHHLDYDKFQHIDTEYKELAALLNFADRIDVYINYYGEKDLTDFLSNRIDNKISSSIKELFIKADMELNILKNIKNESYLDEMNQVYEEITYTEKEKEMFLSMLIYSIDFRSEYTVMHTITTVSVADEIGRLMKLDNSDLENLHYGALLHDIGKITTPIQILEAPRKLSDEEMVIMKNHVKMSEYILKEYIKEDILEIAIRHHEKIDGTGYYRKLKGEDLTRPQRILAVADIISALCGKRSYKDSFHKEKILTILKKDKEMGKLCPDVVDTVTNNFEDIMLNVNIFTEEPLRIYSEISEKYSILYNQLHNLESL